MNESAVQAGCRSTRQKTRQKRTRRVETRVTPDELAAIDRFCKQAGVSRSEALRWVAGGHARVVHETRNADVERLAAQARLIGVNVNQIARRLNGQGRLSPASAESLESALGRIRDALERVAAETRSLRLELAGRADGRDVDY